MVEKKVQHANNCVRPLACITGLINNEVHLPRDGFTAHPKDGGLPRCSKIDWARLEWVAGIMHLLRKIKRIVRRGGITSRCYHPMGWWRNKHSPLNKVLVHLPLGFLQLMLVDRPLLSHKKQVLFSSM